MRRSTYAEHLAALADDDTAALAWRVHGNGDAITRGGLQSRIAEAKHRFDGWRIGRGDVVAWPVVDRLATGSLLAVLPAVTTLAPLAPGLTADAYARVFARLRVKAAIVPRDVRHPARDAAERLGIATIDPDLAAMRATASLDLPPHLGADVLYVTLTSGTTGAPKLVPHAWGAIATTAEALGRVLAVGPGDVSAHITSMHLANGLRTAMLLSLLNGGAVAVLPEADVDAFLRAVAAGEVTYTSSSFAIHRELLRRIDDGARVAPGRLRFIRVSSGRLEPHEMDRLEAAFGVPVVTGLSCTETGTIAQQALPPGPRVRGSVGRPVASELRIADAQGRVVAAGEVGEVQVRGPQVFGGYIDDPALDAASFVDGWFRLGDTGRLDERGELHLVGRLRETINRGGEKISPHEIDAVLATLPGVVEAAAFGIPHAVLGEEVVAAVVRDRTSAVDAEGLIAEVRAQLGERRAPRRVWFVDALPRTASGKLQRAVLAALVSHNGVAHGDADGVVRTPTPLETALRALWTTTLRHTSVGLDDDFFMLGGDSLRGAKLLMHVRAAFGVELQVQSLFAESSTVAGMARSIEQARARS